MSFSMPSSVYFHHLLSRNLTVFCSNIFWCCIIFDLNFKIIFVSDTKDFERTVGLKFLSLEERSFGWELFSHWLQNFWSLIQKFIYSWQAYRSKHIISLVLASMEEHLFSLFRDESTITRWHVTFLIHRWVRTHNFNRILRYDWRQQLNHIYHIFNI